MEFKSWNFAALFILFFLFFTPCFSRGLSKMDPEVYVIDYRGPETHTYIPPPNRSGGRPHIHRGNVVLHHKSKGGAGKGKKNHG